MINIYDFFEFDENGIAVQKPINRIAYTKEDIDYKLKYIKAMQELGMEVTIDKAGNICGTIPGKIRTDKSIVLLSHTDSVDNGGQFDGPLGVFSALKTAETMIQNNTQNPVNLKIVICACEESYRFDGKACIGSKYLRGDNLDFDKTISRDGLSLQEIVTKYKADLLEAVEKSGLKPLKEVDKVLDSNNEIITAMEGHIEQADTLHDHHNNIGICTSITAPYRLNADISDIKTAADFICDLTHSAKQPENLQKYRATVPNFSIKNDVNLKDLQDKQILTFRAKGKANHSGSTPMDQREDAVYGAAKLIQEIAQIPDIQFLETYTPKYNNNGITDTCDLQFAVNKNFPYSKLLPFLERAQNATNVTFENIPAIQKTPETNTKWFKNIRNPFKRKQYIPLKPKIPPIPKVDEKGEPLNQKTGLFIDVRQQIGMEPSLTSDMIWDCIKDIIHITGKSCHMSITSKGTPYATNANLVDLAEQICTENKIDYEVLKSWAGHDLATLTSNELVRTILLFCASTGGSHNPNETTTLENINSLIHMESKLAQKEMEKAIERANEIYPITTTNEIEKA